MDVLGELLGFLLVGFHGRGLRMFVHIASPVVLLNLIDNAILQSEALETPGTNWEYW